MKKGMMMHQAWILILLMLTACGGEAPDDRILVTVNGAEITEAELDRAIKRTLGVDSSNEVDAKLRRSILETMVLSRVLLQSAEDKLDMVKKRELDSRIQSYREDLYIKAYLQTFAPPQPPSGEMIREYYQSNPEKFGGGRVQQFEMLAGVLKQDDGKREPLMRAFAKAAEAKDWRQYSKQLLQQGLSVRYSQGQASDPVLHERLRQAMHPLQTGAVSPVVLVDGEPYVIRVNAVEVVEPKPLEQVSGDIRRMLVPVQLKKSLDKVSEELMATADIEYSDNDH